MNERLTQLRMHLNLSQEEMGTKIGVSRFSISNYESGKRNLTDRTIADICREFRVNEEWFRSGIGEMFLQTDDNIINELSAKYGLSTLDKKILAGYLSLPDQDKQILKNLVLRLASDYTETRTLEEQREIDKQKELDAYSQELDAESMGKTSYHSAG